MTGTLFFADPFPIRNDVRHFEAVAAQRWAAMVESFAEVSPGDYRLFCNQATYHQILAQRPVVTPFVLTTTPSEEDRLRASAPPWNEAGIALWLDILAGGGGRPEAQLYGEILARLRSLYDFTTLVMWGGNGTVSAFCRENAILPVYMELAPFRPPFPSAYYLDPRGVNGAHSAAAVGVAQMQDGDLLPVEIVIDAVNPSPLREPSLYDGKWDAFVVPGASRRGTDRRVLVPLQIRDDANILLNSPFKSMAEFVRHCLAELPSEDTVVFKPHPGAFHRGGIVLSDHVAARREVDARPNAFWDDAKVPPSDYLAYLRSFDAVVTINSSVGFEASLVGVPSVALGNALYRPKDAISSIAELEAALANDPRELMARQGTIAAYLFKTVFLNALGLQREPGPFEARLDVIRRIGDPDDCVNYLDTVARDIPYQTWRVPR
ncbi:hypothetical protein [Acuticoccus sp.]|uniref:capsular polysaccharide export protein, LipB/KpsS family n=1 Tax=Acuticoccus sp. TaxID=1904378 RepID=UPI003B52FFB7